MSGEFCTLPALFLKIIFNFSAPAQKVGVNLSGLILLSQSSLCHAEKPQSLTSRRYGEDAAAVWNERTRPCPPKV
jgi:hypothetical protein